MIRQGVVGLFLAFAVFVGSDSALASSFRFVDEDGVVHFTNAPADPRYRRFTAWTGDTPERLRPAEGRRARYAAIIQEAASRYGVEAGLVEALIWVESTFDPWAVSRKGAQGLMQLMPATASALGIRDVFDPRENVDGGVRHLQTLLSRYNGDLPLALAAYNAGDEAVRSYRGVPPYPETQHYVRKILQLYGSSPPEAGPQLVYRHADSRGTVTYTNLPPTTRP